ncbi:MAG TPA: hypothetical protein VK801_16440 [Caulobacteraceae bacterium]|nr:hypothetical protein [Caulobacteraceae bacterium]
MTTRDYGVQRPPRRRALTIYAGAMIALAVVALVMVVAADRSTRMSQAREWTASGPPCARSSAAALLAANEAPDQLTVFQGVRFARTHGAIRCNTIGYNEGRSGDDFPVCEFDHPGGVEITTSSGRYDFLLNPMYPATVQVQHGVPACVVGSTVEIH